MEQIKNLTSEVLCHNWGTLSKLTYLYGKSDGSWEKQTREVYDRGDGVTILLYHPQKHTVILTRQLRIPTYLNGNADGHLIEAPAGKLDQSTPEECIKKEVLEETGYEVHEIKKIFEVYMSPGSVTELIHFYIAEYSEEMKIAPGGGAVDEQENIEVLELPIKEALQMIKEGRIKDAKTIMLLQYAQNMR